MTRTGILAGSVAAVAMMSGAAQAERGADGELRVLLWQAPSTMNLYLSGGTKDLLAGSFVLEPLARYDEDGGMVPFLVDEIPTIENGGVAEDLKSITWKLKDGLKWSDGSDVTAEDVVFTWKYCVDPEGGCAQTDYFEGIESVEAVDAQNVRVNFTTPTPYPYRAFVGHHAPVLQAAQFAGCLGAAAAGCTAQNFGPIGTGPFRVVEFRANDVITLEANPFYRDPAKPAFASLTVKGGGDPASAARAVLETGEFDYAWNLQIEPEILDGLARAGKGEVISAFGAAVERIEMNQYNPDPALGDKRSTIDAGPHPFNTDPAVARALSLAIDRNIIVAAGYGPAGRPTCNNLAAPEIYASTANDWCLTQDLDEANRLLDEAGWVPGPDGVRVRDGVRLSILFQTSTNSVRQGTQALIKNWWKAIGVETELRNISGSVFFGGDPASPDTLQKFYADAEEFNKPFSGNDPSNYLAGWTCSSIPRPDTNWLGENMARYCNPEYDALVEKLSQTTAPEDRAAIGKALNDLIVGDGAILPLVHRGSVAARSNSLAGVRMNAWDSDFWNIADWSRAR